MTESSYLFDDNPATQDLTGLHAVAVAVANVAVDARFETLTVGLNSPWGGGKSTALNLIEEELRRRDEVVVVVIDPWEFVDSGDARGTLINRVLEGIAAELDSERLAKRVGGAAKLAGVASDLIDKLNALRKRVSWSKVAQVAITSAVTLTPNITGLVDALTPEPAKAPAAKGMRDFRADFGELLAGMGEGWRVVVLIDDLDRSLPDDVLGALEAIKLFLSVKGMSFVIAADDDFIRESLRDASIAVAAAEVASLIATRRRSSSCLSRSRDCRRLTRSLTSQRCSCRPTRGRTARRSSRRRPPSVASRAKCPTSRQTCTRRSRLKNTSVSRTRSSVG